MKQLIIVAVVAIAGVLAWQNLPGLRSKITKAANEYGGWTEEARRDDPVGFIQHAQKALKADIVEFEKAQGSLGVNRQDAEKKLEEFRDEEQNSASLANTLRELYKGAEENGAWPVTFLEGEYSRSQLIEQVEKALATKKNAIARQADYQEVIDKVALTQVELSKRIDDSNVMLDELEAQELMVKVDKLSTETDELLAKVNELVEGNTRVAENPVRSVDELLQAAADQAAAEEKAAEPSEALDFLNS